MHSVVLGAGGPVAAAWLGGLTSGLTNAGLPLRETHQILGTAAGAVVGAWLASDAGAGEVTEVMTDRMAWHTRRTRLGDKKSEVSQDEAAALWQRWLPQGGWPAVLRVAAVAAQSRRLCLWSSRDGVALGAAVASSTAVPELMPAVRINGKSYVYGAVRSVTNADAAASRIDTDGASILVCAPVVPPNLSEEIAILRGLGCAVTVLRPEPGELPRLFTTTAGWIADPNMIAVAAAAGRRKAEAVMSRRSSIVGAMP